MIKALLLLFLPARTWEGIERAQRSFIFVLAVHVLPLIALSVAGEILGRNWLAKSAPGQPSAAFADDVVAGYAIAEFLVSLAMIFVGASLIKSVSQTFHNRHGYALCFKLTAYSLSPFFLLHLLDAFPHLNPWISFAAGMVCSASALYYGIPYFLKPDPPHAFGVFLTGTILLTMAGVLTRIFTLLVLQKKVHFF